MIVLCDQNFPAVLPSASGKCVAIMRIEHGTLKELVELIEKVAPPPHSSWHDFHAWLPDTLAEGGAAELLCFGGQIWPQIGEFFPGNRDCALHSPPPWVDVRIRNWFARFWMDVSG